MQRRYLAAGAVLAVLITFGGLGTARAHQASDIRQYQRAAMSDQLQTSALLRHVLRAGLPPAQVGVFNNRVAQLRSERVPAANPLWDGARLDFYGNLSASYAALRVAIHAAAHRNTAKQRSGALAQLAALQRGITYARSLQVNTGPAASVLSKAQLSLRARHSARTYRRIATTLTSASRTLQAQASQQLAAVTAVEHSAGGSIPSISGLADTVVSNSQSQATLLALFTTRTSGELAELQRLDAAVHAAHDVRSAALAELAVQNQGQVISADFKRTVPDKVIVVSTENQSVTMYQGGKQVDSAPVTTGGPELPTDHGVFHIYDKISPFVFHSPWPPGSPYYYLPSPVEYWMPFDGAEGLHDAPWRSNFGPGSNLAPTDLGTGNYILGTHGCVNLPSDTAAFVWNWAPIGTTVVVI